MIPAAQEIEVGGSQVLGHLGQHRLWEDKKGWDCSSVEYPWVQSPVLRQGWRRKQLRICLLNASYYLEILGGSYNWGFHLKKYFISTPWYHRIMGFVLVYWHIHITYFDYFHLSIHSPTSLPLISILSNLSFTFFVILTTLFKDFFIEEKTCNI